MKFRKLTEGVEVDSLGNQLTPEQSKYFANSKVRDRNGNLLVVHHGTYNSFDSFDAGDIGFHFGTEKAAIERKDYYDSDTDQEWNVGKYYLNITNYLDMYDIADWDGSNLAAHIIESRLLDLSDEDIKYLQQIQMMGGLGMGRNHEPTTMLRKFLTDRGIDGIMYENAYEDSGSISYIAFNPEQIKFITNKTPTSSKNMNEDIWDSSRTTYQPKNDAKFRRLIKKPLNTLTVEDIKYIYTISDCDYMRLYKQYDSISDALNSTNDRMDGIYFQECADFFQSLSFPLTVYRAIRNDEFVDGKFKISGKNNSRSWSVDKNIYSDKSSKFRNVTSIVACEVEHSDIDVMHTVSNFIYYSSSRRMGGYGEYEITMKKSFSPSEKNNLRWVKNPIDNKNLNEGADNIPSLEDIENLFSDLGYDGSQQINHSVFIFPDGKAFYGDTHEDFYMELCDRGLIDDYYDDFLVTKYDCIRCCDIDDYENYIELPKTVTMKQLYTLEDWLSKAENRYCYDHIQICSRRESFIENVYDLNALRREGEDVVRYIMNRIKRFVSSGVLLEGTLIAEPNVYVDFVNELHSTFNSMSTEQIVSFLNINQRNDLDTESPMFILPNGKFVSVQETLDTNGVDVDELTHQSICECFAWCLMSDLKYDTDTVAEIVDQDWRIEREFAYLLSELTYKLGWARINCGTKSVDDRFYCVLPNEVANKQWWSLENWLNWGYDKNKSDVLVFVTDSAIAKKFKMNDFAPVFPEEIIKNIRRFYSSGRFYEGLNEKIEHLIIDEESSDYDKLFVTDSVRELKRFMDTAPWDEFKVVDSSDHDGNYYVGDALHDIHSSILRKAVDNGWFPVENNLTIHRSFAESELVLIERGKGQHRGMFGEDWYDYMFIFEDYTILARDDIRHAPLIKQFGKLIEIREFDESGENPGGIVLTESLQRLASNAFITDNPYQVRDLLMNKPKLYRILYDRNIDMYMIGDGNELIHWDLIREARKQGYYASMEEFIDELGELDNYVEFGEGGQFLGDEEIESYLIYMVFSPDEEEFMLGEDGYQFRYQLPFGVMFTRDSYLEDCDLYKVVKATANISEGKEMNKLTEGVWSMPDSQEKVDIISELFKNPIGVEEVEGVKDKLYDILGSDDLFDCLDEEDNEDYRYVIASYIEQLLDNHSEDIDDNLGKQLNDIIQSFDSFYGSKNYMNEGIVHTDEDDNVNGLKLASLLKVGDVFYDDYTQHRMKVIAVSPNNVWSVLVAVEDLQTGENKEMRLGVSSIVELAGENDIEVEVDDDIDIEWHPIDDYFDGNI